MSTHRLAARLTTLASTLGLVAAGLAVGATSGGAAAASFPMVEVFVKRDHTVVMPAQITPGTNRFVITSARDAGFQMLQAAPGYTKREAVRDIVAGLNNGRMAALRRFEANTTLLGGLPSERDKRAVMWTELEAGTYWALDTMKMVPEAADITTFTVAGTPTAGRVKGQVIRATGEAKWGPMTPTLTRRGTITFQNTSDANHFLGITKLARGKTMEDFRRWMRQLKQGNETPPPVNFNVSIDTGVISGGESMTFRYSLPPGKYVMICWWPMADHGGMPHAMMGMFRGVTVS